MKRIYVTMMLLAMIFATISITACGAADDDVSNGGNIPNGKNGKRLVKTTLSRDFHTLSDLYDLSFKSISHDSSSIQYTYDEAGRINKIEKTTFNSNNKDTHTTYSITYYDNSIIRRENGKVVKEYTLNDGLITKMATTNTDLLVEYSVRFFYENGYCVEKEYPGLILKSIWSNGNIVKMEEYSDEGKTLKELEVIYSNYKDYNVILLHLMEECEEGIGYFGKYTENLPLRINLNGEEFATYEWTIQNGIITKGIIRRRIPLGSSTFDTYTYYFEWE